MEIPLEVLEQREVQFDWPASGWGERTSSGQGMEQEVSVLVSVSSRTNREYGSCPGDRQADRGREDPNLSRQRTDRTLWPTPQLLPSV